jgi:peptide/nickel transport system substrate-binding protein
MSRDITGRDIDRRDILKGLGVAGMAGLAGCAGGDSTPTPNQGEDDGGDDSTPEPTATPEKLGDTLVNPDGDQVTLTAVYSTGGQTTETTMEFIKQELGKVGIRVELTGTQFQSMLANYAQNSTEDGSATFNGGPRDESTSSNQWDLMGGIGFNSYPRTPSSIRPFWIDVENPGASVNFYGYKPSKAIQPKVDEASSTTDPEQRQSLFAEIFGTLSRDQPVNFLTFSNDLLGFRSNVSGLGEAVFGFGYQSQSRYFGSGVAAVGGSYTNGAASGAKTLNPIRSNDTSSDARIGLTMDGAYTLDPQNNFVPRWFESVESNDALDTYTFTLRDNLQWSGNYGQMTADDWVYYIQNVRQAEPNWTGDVNHGDWFRTVDGEQQPIEVSAPSELELQVSLPDTDPAFVSKPVLWGAYCMPRGLIEPYYERVQDASSEEAKIEIGNELNEDEEVQTLAYTGNLGPFDYERWDRTSVFVSTRDPDYYGAGTAFEGDVPYFEQSSIQVFGEQSTRLAALRTGEIDSTALPPAQVQEFEQNSDINVLRVPSAFCGMLVYNQRANGWEELRKREVRQALSMAVSKTTIAEQINRGTAAPAYTHQPEFSRWFDSSQVTRFGGSDSTSIGGAQRMLADALPEGYEFQ